MVSRAWIRRRRDSGVSPVIGVILMVAITVVLAGVVYYMVGQMGEDPAEFRVGRINTWERTNMTGGEFIFTPFSPATRPLDIYLMFVLDGEVGDLLRFDDATSTYGPIANHTIKYHDIGDDQYINSGDYITVTNMVEGVKYVIYIIDANTGDVMQEFDFIYR